MLSLIGPQPFLTKDDRTAATAAKSANGHGQPNAGGGGKNASLDEDEIVSFIPTSRQLASASASLGASSVRTEQLDSEAMEMVTEKR